MPLSKLKSLNQDFRKILSILPIGLRKSIWLVFVWMSAASLIEMISIFALTLFFKLLITPAFLLEIPAFQSLLQEHPDLNAAFQDPKFFMLLACAIPIIFVVIKNIFSAIVTWKSSILSEKIAAYAGKTIMNNYLYMPFSWHLSTQKSNAIMAMIKRFELGAMLLHILNAYSNLITAFVLFGGLFLYAPVVSAGSVFAMLVLSIVTYTVLKNRIDKSGQLIAIHSAKENEATQTALEGAREIIIYQKQNAFLEKLNEAVNALRGPRSFINLSYTVPTWTLESGGFFLIWLTIYFMNYYTTASMGEVTETIALLALTAWRILPALNRIVGSIVMIRGVKPQAMICIDYLATVKEAENLQNIDPDHNFKIDKAISFNHVTYSYSDSSNPALCDITCDIPLGSTIGLVGKSGSGKTTFINILSGLLEPTSGELLVDGNPLTAAQLISYRQKIGYVPQSPYVLRGSIKQNVAFKDWGEDIDIEKVKNVCDLAAIDFLGANYENLDNPAANALSGGQMQRVSIARALYTDPVILIFDEATSALDQSTEGKVQQAMMVSKGLRTNIIAAHRLETLEICDFIFWLEDGRLVKTGKTDEVLPIYKESLKNTEECA